MRNGTAGLFIKPFSFDMQKHLHVSFTTDLTKKLLAYSKLSPKQLKWSLRIVYLWRAQKNQTQTVLFYKPTTKDKEKKKYHWIEWRMKQLQKEQNFYGSNFYLAAILSSFTFLLLLILTGENVIWLTCPFYVGVSYKVHLFLLFICLQFKVSFKLISN